MLPYQASTIELSCEDSERVLVVKHSIIVKKL